MKKWNLVFGFLFLLAFLATGQYMRHVFLPEYSEALIQRMQIRSNHIYLLFIALLNLLAAGVEVPGRYKWSALGSGVARLLLILAGCCMLVGFWNEHDGNLTHRTYTRLGIFASLGGVSLLMLIKWGESLLPRQQNE